MSRSLASPTMCRLAPRDSHNLQQCGPLGDRRQAGCTGALQKSSVTSSTLRVRESGREPGARLKVQAAISIRSVCRVLTIGAQIAGTQEPDAGEGTIEFVD